MIKKELTKYVVVGISAVATDFIMYRLLGFIVSVSLAKGISYVCGMIVAFALNRSWTFQSTGKAHHDLFRFSILYSCSLILNVGINHSILYFFPGAIILGFGIATGISVVTNYVGQKFWVFKS